MANAVLKYQRELAEWKTRGKAIIDTAEAEDRDLTDEENDDVAEVENEIERAQSRLDRALKAQAWEREEATVTVTHQEDDTATDNTTTVSATAKDHTPPTPFANFGEQLVAIRNAAQGIDVDPRLLEVQGAAAGAGRANPSEGGFLIQTDFQSEIIRKIFTTGALASRVVRRSLTGNNDSTAFNAIKETSRATGSRYGGVQAYWVDEGTAPTATNVSLRRIELKLNKLAALGYVTDELMQDAPMMADEMTDAFSEEIMFAVENSIFRGTGAGQPLGLLAHASAIDVSAETGQAASTILYENLIKMWARLFARSRANSVWLINQDCEPQLDQLALTVGTGGLEPRFITYGADGVMRIKGRPVIATEYSSTLGTSGDLMLVDASQYRFIDKGAVKQAESMHVRFTTDEHAFRATYRCDGQPTWESALTPFQGSNTQSPIITLATRS